MLIILGIIFKLFSSFEFFSNVLQDEMYQKSKNINPGLIIIGIDEDSYRKYGKFSGWSRQLHLDLINYLNEAGASVIGFDITFEDKNLLEPEVDEEFVKSAANMGNIVMPYSIDLSLNEVIGPFEELSNVVKKGHIFTYTDSDGVVRDTAITYTRNNKIYRSFAWTIYELYMLNNGQYVNIEPLPLYKENNSERMYIDYSGTNKDYPIISYSSYMEYDKSIFKDKIVLIGPFVAAIQDSYPTSLEKKNKTYGVLIHANIIQQLLEENYKFKISTRNDFLISVLLIIILSIASFIIIQKLSFSKSSIIHGALILISLITTSILYDNGIIFEIFYLIIQLLIIFIFFTSWAHINESSERRRITSVFEKYVEPQVVNKILSEGEEGLKLGGAKREVSILFVDIRGFTPLAEEIEPEEVVVILNEYLNLTAKSILTHGGMLDKFIGDATMAIFNAPIDLKDHELMAVRAAWDIKKGAVTLNEKLVEMCGRSIGFGVGINTGDAIIGNIGAEIRMDYTAIGDTVNIAARLESNTKAGQIFISEATYKRIQDKVDVNLIGNIKVKGKQEEVLVYEVIDVKQGDV
jgi:adenylate cyclase